MCTWSCSVKKIVVSCLETAKFSSRGSAPHPAGGSAPDPGWAWGFATAPRPLPPLFTTGNYLMHLFVAAPEDTCVKAFVRLMADIVQEEFHSSDIAGFRGLSGVIWVRLGPSK